MFRFKEALMSIQNMIARKTQCNYRLNRKVLHMKHCVDEVNSVLDVLCAHGHKPKPMPPPKPSRPKPCPPPCFPCCPFCPPPKPPCPNGCVPPKPPAPPCPRSEPEPKSGPRPPMPPHPCGCVPPKPEPKPPAPPRPRLEPDPSPRPCESHRTEPGPHLRHSGSRSPGFFFPPFRF